MYYLIFYQLLQPPHPPPHHLEKPQPQPLLDDEELLDQNDDHPLNHPSELYDQPPHKDIHFNQLGDDFGEVLLRNDEVRLFMSYKSELYQLILMFNSSIIGIIFFINSDSIPNIVA